MTNGTSINDPRRSLFLVREAAGARPTPFDPGTERRRYVERRAGFRPSREGPAISVGEVMTRNARTCRPDDRLAAAALGMCEADCRFLPVVDRMGHPIGVLTDGDICLLGSTDRRSLREIFVREVMSGLPATCRADDDVLDALKTMRERHIRHLPVVNAEGMLVGVLSLTDLVLCAEEENSSRLRQEVASTLRAIVQKHGNTRIVRENTFVED
jgi:CBS-domain-containing membrane protein